VFTGLPRGNFVLRKTFSIVVGLLCAVALAPPAHATTPDTLPLPAFGAMAVDQAHKRVFVSGGAASNGILVLDFSGRTVKTLNGQFGATGLVLSEDGRTLYAALAAGDAISAIDTATLTESKRFPTGAQTCPTHLARTGALVWFGYGCDATWNGRIGRLDPVAAEPVVLDKGNVVFQTAPLLSSAGGAAGPLVATQLDLSLADAHVFTVGSGELVAGPAGEVFGSNVLDLAMSPDGATLHSAAGSRDRVEAFAATDLARRGTYVTGPHPNAVRVSPDGRFVAVGAYTSRDKAIWVFAVDAANPVNAFDLDGDVLANRGLAWSGDGKHLFAITQGATDSRPRFTAISRPTED
jgi:DNA-binding beta-propeller fold protein YncE